MCIVSKIYEIIAKKKLREHIEMTMEAKQCGFKPDRRTTNASRSVIRTSNCLSKEFVTTNGVGQGEILEIFRPLLFILLMGKIY